MTIQPGPGEDRSGPSLRAITGERRGLVNLAYRMLGSLAEAEDAVHEAYARWYAMPRDQQQAIESPGAWLTRVTGRICLDLLGSARARRERCVGQWLPEPLPDHAEWTSAQPAAAADPADRVTLDDDDPGRARRVRAARRLRLPFADVAEIVGRTPAASRKLGLLSSPPSSRGPASGTPEGRPGRNRPALREASDISALIRLLDPDAVMTADGGGVVAAALRPIQAGRTSCGTPSASPARSPA